MERLETKLREIMKSIRENSIDGIRDLIELYKNVTSEERKYIRENAGRELTNKLIAYSHSAAVEGVRRNSKEVLFNGIVAQSIEDAQMDWRDNVGNLFLIWHSAKRINENPDMLLRDVIKMSSKSFGELLYDFLGRNDLDSNITKLSGYKVVEVPEFDYVWKDEVIKTREELRQRLVDEKVREDAWCLDGGFPSETYVLGYYNRNWEVYYSEKGLKSGLKMFHKEEDACEYFYEWVTTALRRMGLL